MSIIGYTLVIAGIIFCWLISILLWRFSYKEGIQQKLLSLIFLIIGWYAFTYLLVAKGWFIYCPFVFRLGMPFYYLVPPFALFYTQLLLKERNTISSKINFVHCLPFLVSLVDLAVYYSKNYGNLRYITEQVLLDPVNSYILGSGFIPAWRHYFFRPVHGCFYVILIAVTFYKALKSKRIQNIDKRSRRWLFTLDGFLTLNYTSIFYTSFIKPTNSYPVLETSIIFAFTLVVCFFLMSIKPFFSPFLIYQSKDKNNNKSVAPIYEQANNEAPDIVNVVLSEPKKKLLSHERAMEIASVMDKAMSEQQLFKKVSKIGNLADYLNLSPRYLSYVLNKHYELNFNDYLNSFRINYVIQLIENEQHKQFTFEALAREAGFSSRTTFFTAFKKQMGVNPTQYLNEK
ncbi:helix-turn-helix domain-containing protein [Olivibacter domesticus]|uniref:Helix-turn-helix domain-containing protein n=1 Tax=Olivibacter domesticus TaxID=407022 RepID=A0A1H7UD15_OLID1|nr:helix-turn-helix domain-containing protein [Olivibacter domesticus]SEL94654.1 Helix-turn-helix domain-containing protein [Olivibacter domesticus]